MCGRFVQERSVTELAELFSAEPIAVDDDSLAAPRYNLAPTDPAAVVVERVDHRRAVVPFRWGLIPHWAPDASIAARTINARAETVATLPAFRDAFRRRRCLVPADGFYEWTTNAEAAGPRSRRTPFLIRRADRRPMAFAGLWSSWRNPASGESRRTFAIVTRAAGAAIRPLHDRMPVVVEPEDWATWLAPDVDPVALQVLLDRPAEAPVELVRVRPLVNSVRNQGPELVEPADA